MAYSKKVVEHYENPRNVGGWLRCSAAGGCVNARPTGWC